VAATVITSRSFITLLSRELLRRERTVERIQQIRGTERLEEVSRCSLGHCTGATRRIPVRGNENDRHFLAMTLEYLLKLKSGHAWHRYVKNQTICLVDTFGSDELFSRRKYLDGKSELLDQMGKRLAYGLVVIHD
jgi:hypothetical protein